MAELRPFRALRYDPAHVELARVLVPPYDVVGPEERALYYESDPRSAIRLELTRRPEEEATTDYSQAADILRAWRREEVLVQDAQPAFYGLRQRCVAPDGSAAVRAGFFALLRLEDYAHRVVLPHERTLAGPKADRLKQLRATRANLSSVFFLYDDRGHELRPVLAEGFAAPALAAAVDRAGIEHALYRLDAAPLVQRVQRFFADQSVVIADGHHRYETALAYRDEQRAQAGDSTSEAGCEWILGYFANAFASGTLLLPIHRVVRSASVPPEARWRERLATWREERVPLGGSEEVPGLLAKYLEPHAGEHAFAVDDNSGSLRIFRRPADGELGVRVLEREVLGDVFGLDPAAIREGALAFTSDAARAASLVREGQGTAALFLNPLQPDDVFRVTRAGEVLPQKSTFFFPKLPSGLLFRTLEEQV